MYYHFPDPVLKQVNKRLDRLEKMGVVEKVDYSNWASPIVDIKEKNYKIRVCADFSMGLNN